jgi:transaldolase
VQGLQSLIQCGTKLWLDSIDPELLQLNLRRGATGATSNPIIVADILKSGRYDEQIVRLLHDGFTDDQIVWTLTDMLVRKAQDLFMPVFESTGGDDGYVSFELDPLLEDFEGNISQAERVARYIDLGKQWSRNNPNRMIKVPATPTGIEALEPLAAAGVSLNVTLIFSPRQYRVAREAIWSGAQRRATLDQFKSVYSVFVSRVDVWTAEQVSELSSAAQGLVGILIAKRIWRDNQQFWADKSMPLRQEIIFASTGTKDPKEDPGKYVVALAGSDIQTNPPATNEAVEQSGRVIERGVCRMVPQEIVDEIDRLLDMAQLEEMLVREGIIKFTSPQKDLLLLIQQKRAALVSSAHND